MANDKSSTQKLIDALFKIIDEIEKIKISELAKGEQFGAAYGFQNDLPLFQTAQQMIMYLRNCALANLPEGILTNNIDACKNLLSVFQKIAAFDPAAAGTNPQDARQAILTEFKNAYQKVFANLAPIFSHEIRSEGRAKIAQQKIDALVADLEKSKGEFQDDKRKYTTEFAETLKSMKDAAGKEAISRYASIFKIQSEDHGKRAGYWLLATLLCIAGIIGVTYHLFITPFTLSPAATEDSTKKPAPVPASDPKLEASSDHKDEPPTLGLIRQFSGRFVIISTVFFLLTLCAKNYASHQHNAVVNRHRQNALETFQAFVQSAGSDSGTRNAVLLEATHCIFSVQPSGFGQKQADVDTSPKILELIRPLTEKSH